MIGYHAAFAQRKVREMKRILVLACAGLIAGCAADPASSTEPVQEREYRTGSNIPKKGDDRGTVTTMSPEEIERSRNASMANMNKGRGN